MYLSQGRQELHPVYTAAHPVSISEALSLDHSAPKHSEARSGPYSIDDHISKLRTEVRMLKEQDDYRNPEPLNTQAEALNKDLEPIPVYNLSLKQKSRKKCELCKDFGCYMCQVCKSAFYCTLEHFKLDQELHRVICLKLKILRTPVKFHADEVTRNRMKKQYKILLRELCTFAYWEGKLALESGNTNLAIAAASLVVKNAKEAFGDSRILIPPLLVIAEAYLDSGKLQLAEGFIDRVTRLEVDLPDIELSIKANIRHNEGLASLARNKLEESRYCFAEEIYLNTEAFGPSHIRTAPGYSHLGNVFLHMHNYPTAVSLFRFTVEIWLNFSQPIIEQMRQEMMPVHHTLALLVEEEKEYINKRDEFEGIKILRTTMKYMNQLPNEVRPISDLANLKYTVASLYLISRRYEEFSITMKELKRFCHFYNFGKEDLLKKMQLLRKICRKRAPLSSSTILSSRHSADNISPGASSTISSLTESLENKHLGLDVFFPPPPPPQR